MCLKADNLAVLTHIQACILDFSIKSYGTLNWDSETAFGTLYRTSYQMKNFKDVYILHFLKYNDYSDVLAIGSFRPWNEFLSLQTFFESVIGSL